MKCEKTARVCGLVVRVLDWLGDLLTFALRGWWGYQFAITGWGKLHNLDRTAGFFGSLGIPAPKINAAMAGSTEFLGGVLLGIGLLSRPAGAALTGVMSVAYLTAHRDALAGLFHKPEDFIAAEPFWYLVIALLVLAHGPGMLSLDALIAFLARHRVSESFLALFVGRNTTNRILCKTCPDADAAPIKPA